MPRIRRQKINAARATRIVPEPDALIRFLKKIKQQDGRMKTPCWIWTGHCDENGYAQVKLAGRAMWAHRVAYAIFVRSIPDGREIDHLCNTTSCVNPRHLKCRTKIRNSENGARFRNAVRDEIPF